MKVIQSEMSVGVLMKRCEKFMFVKTVLPSQLHVADAVTAETLRRVSAEAGRHSRIAPAGTKGTFEAAAGSYRPCRIEY